MAAAVHEPVLAGDHDLEHAAAVAAAAPSEPLSWPVRGFAASLLVVQVAWLGLLYAALQLLF